MACQWQQQACEQLAFWTDVLGVPDVFNSAPSGEAVWYAATLGRATFLGERVPWLMVRVADTLRPLTIDAQIKLPSAAIVVLERELLTMEYTKPSNVTTFHARDQIAFVASWATVHGLLVGRNMHRAAAALEDTERILRISYAAGDMVRMRNMYSTKPVATSEDVEEPVTERSAAPRPPVRIVPNATRGTVLERRNAAASGPVADRVDSKEHALFNLI